MRGLVLLANGFEDTEALTTRDVLIRSGIEMVSASISETKTVVSSFGVSVLSDKLLKEINNIDDFDFIVLPGGGRGTQNLKESKLVEETVRKFADKNKILCAICAAPSIFGKYGLLVNKNYTCFAGCNEGVIGNFTGNEVEVDGNIITARSMMYSIPFALTIIEKLLGKDTKERVLVGLKGQVSK